jgi:hypothetical protein
LWFSLLSKKNSSFSCSEPWLPRVGKGVGNPSKVASTSATFGKYEDDTIKPSTSIYGKICKVKAYNGDLRGKNVQVDPRLGS